VDGIALAGIAESFCGQFFCEIPVPRFMEAFLVYPIVHLGRSQKGKDQAG